MPCFFFHLRSAVENSEDDLGTELPNAEAAYLEACAAALEMSIEMLRKRIDPAPHSFRVMDVRGQLLFDIPFSEVLSPGRRPPMPVRVR